MTRLKFQSDLEYDLFRVKQGITHLSILDSWDADKNKFTKDLYKFEVYYNEAQKTYALFEQSLYLNKESTISLTANNWLCGRKSSMQTRFKWRAERWARIAEKRLKKLIHKHEQEMRWKNSPSNGYKPIHVPNPEPTPNPY